jgi:phage terminase small subunit
MMAKSWSANKTRDVGYDYSARETAFVAEYLVDYDATRAAKAAGYSAKTASQHASRMLKKPKIKALIRKRKVALSKRRCLRRKDVEKSVANAINRDLTDLCNNEGVVLSNLQEIPKRAHAFVDGLEVDQKFGIDPETGEQVVTGQKIRYKLSPIVREKELAAKILGMLQPEKHDVSVKLKLDLQQLYEDSRNMTYDVDDKLKQIESEVARKKPKS